MKITQSHYTFWLERTSRIPRWADTVRIKRPLVSVHDLINAQVEKPMHTRSVEPGNTLSILRLNRRATVAFDVVERLRKMAANPENPKRGAYARRWLKRMGAYA